MNLKAIISGREYALLEIVPSLDGGRALLLCEDENGKRAVCSEPLWRSCALTDVQLSLIHIYAAVQRGDGPGHQRGRRENHQIGRHGHGSPGKISGVLGRYGRCAVPAVFQPVWHPCLYHTYQNHCHYGCGGRKAPLGHQFRRGKGHGAHLGVHLPRLRAYQFHHGKAVYGHFLNRF